VPTRRAATVAGQEPWRELIGNRPGVEDLADAKRIPVAAVDANPEQPRKTPLEGIEELAGSIREYGLLQPVVVTPPLAGRYTLLAGHRRLAAYRWLADNDRSSAWTTIPAIERDTATADRLVVALLENLSRQDLTDAEIIAGLLVLRDLRGWSQQEIARRVGVSKGWLSQYFRVATDAVVSVHVQRGELRVGKAYEIVRAQDRGGKVAALDAAPKGPRWRPCVASPKAGLVTKPRPARRRTAGRDGPGPRRPTQACATLPMWPPNWRWPSICARRS
jgi:ParB/RepB/Spo0J family partition protein